MTFNEAVLDVIESSAYSMMGDYDRYKVLRNVQENFDKAARNALLEEDVELMVRLEARQEAINERRGQ